ncbi:MAG: hypothetical protein H7X70_02090 [Candidatus Kapabacteria bacterium]|nr:hypothetical protein [Candidatus Kapabacteria bacterium]
MNRDHLNDPLAPLRDASVPFTLAESIDHAHTRTGQKRQVPLIAALVMSVLAGVSLIWWYTTGPSTTPERIDIASVVAPASANIDVVEAPAASAPRLERKKKAIDIRTNEVRPQQEIRSLLEDVGHTTPGTLRALDVDLTAYHEIRTMLGTMDRVLVVDNTANRETCLQITCEGGDSRSIVCSAPAPSPFRVTKLNGDLIFDIERADGALRTGPYVPIRARIANEDILLWYENAPALMAKLNDTKLVAPAVTYQYSVARRPNKSIVIDHRSKVGLWRSSALHRIDGTSVNESRVVWHSVEGSGVQVSISDIQRGVYELRSICANGASERLLLVVR